MGGTCGNSPAHQLKTGTQFGLGADQLHGRTEGASTLPQPKRKRNGSSDRVPRQSPDDRLRIKGSRRKKTQSVVVGLGETLGNHQLLLTAKGFASRRPVEPGSGLRAIGALSSFSRNCGKTSEGRWFLNLVFSSPLSTGCGQSLFGLVGFLGRKKARLVAGQSGLKRFRSPSLAPPWRCRHRVRYGTWSRCARLRLSGPSGRCL